MAWDFLKRKKEMLLLEPSEVNRQAIEAALKPLGFGFVVVKSGEAALAQIRKSLPQLMVLDLAISDIEPFRLILRLKNNPVTRGVPLVVCSRVFDNEMILRAISEGVNHFAAFPFDPPTFRDRIEMILSGKNERQVKRQYREVAYQEPVSARAFGRLSYVDEKSLRIESNVKLNAGDEITLSSPIYDEIGCGYVVHKVKHTFTDDLYYFYQEAAVLEPQLKAEEKTRFVRWLKENRVRNVPKKTKILFVQPESEAIERILQDLSKDPVSVRVVPTMREAAEQVRFMRPRIIVVDLRRLQKEDMAPAAILCKNYVAKQTCQVVACALSDRAQNPFSSLGREKLFALYHENVDAMLVPALRGMLPSASTAHTEASRIYFSKSDACSTIGIHMKGEILKIGEEGVEVELENFLYSGTNLQLSLKLFTKAGLRNPFVRVIDGKKGVRHEKVVYSYGGYFMGINDIQSAHVRGFVIDQDLAQKRAAMAAKKEADEPEK